MNHMRLILAAKIKYFKKSEIVYVKVPKNFPEFHVLHYAEKFLEDEKIR